MQYGVGIGKELWAVKAERHKDNLKGGVFFSSNWSTFVSFRRYICRLIQTAASRFEESNSQNFNWKSFMASSDSISSRFFSFSSNTSFFPEICTNSSSKKSSRFTISLAPGLCRSASAEISLEFDVSRRRIFQMPSFLVFFLDFFFLNSLLELRLCLCRVDRTFSYNIKFFLSFAEIR